MAMTTDIARAADDWLHWLEVRKRSHHTLTKYRQVLRDFHAGVPVSSLLDLSHMHVDSYLELRRDLSGTAARLHVSVLRAWGKWLASHGYVQLHPFADVELPECDTAPRVGLPVHQLEQILTYKGVTPRTGYRDRALWHLMALCGLRISEARVLRLMDVDETDVRIVRGKGAKSRVVPMLPRCWVAVDTWRSCLPAVYGRQVMASDWLFPGHRAVRPVAQAVVDGAFRRMVLRLRMSDVSCHTLRHTYAYMLLQAGVDIRHIQKLLGHSELSTTQIYLTLSSVDVRNAAHRHPLAI